MSFILCWQLALSLIHFVKYPGQKMCKLRIYTRISRFCTPEIKDKIFHSCCLKWWNDEYVCGVVTGAVSIMSKMLCYNLTSHLSKSIMNLLECKAVKPVKTVPIGYNIVNILSWSPCHHRTIVASFCIEWEI